MTHRVASQMFRSLLTSSKYSHLRNVKNFGLSRSTAVSSYFNLQDPITQDFSSTQFHRSFINYNGQGIPLKSQLSSECVARSSIGAWILAGTIPVCYLSFATSVSAKEKPSVELPEEVILYQYEACPFCNKLRAYLDYRDIPYKVVEVNPLSKKEIKWSEYKKVPILMVDGEQMNDSTAIITNLEKTLFPESRQSLGEEEGEEEEWRKWVDNHLVHLLAPNIYRSTKEALEAFEYITTHGNFSFFERAAAKYAGAASMYFISKRLKKRHNIENERESLYNAAEEWVKALNGRDFLGGNKPNLADLAAFGVLRPIRNLQAGKDMVSNTSIGPWYERMEKEVGGSSRLD